MIEPAARMRKLSRHFFSTHLSRVSELEKQGCEVIRLDEGSPDLPPARHILKALERSAEDSRSHGYQPHFGPMDLRQAWAHMYSSIYQVELDPDQEILPLLGSKEGIFHLATCFVEAGDLVLAPDPGYITYRRGAKVAGGEVYRMPLLAENSYLPDLDTIPDEVLAKAKILWLNYPHNPTTAVTTGTFFEEAVEFARKHSILLCHDAAYTQVTFTGAPTPSILGVPGAKEVAIEFNTLSKSHNMAGWRSASVVGNASIVRTLHTLKTNVDSGHFLPIMQASVAAMTGDQSWLMERNEVYRQRRDLLIQGLLELGMPVSKPEASIYVWCPVPGGWSSEEFAVGALENACVSLVPGTVFGRHGEGYVRITLTQHKDRIAEALVRLKEWMKL